jgi:hypothetical protein
MLYRHLERTCRLTVFGEEIFQEHWEKSCQKTPSIRKQPAAKKLLREIFEKSRGKERVDGKQLLKILEKNRETLHTSPERTVREIAFLIFDGQEIPEEYAAALYGGGLSFDVFWAIYFSSLQLKKSDVYEYCWANDIRQTKDVTGFILPKPPQEKQTSLVDTLSPDNSAPTMAAWCAALEEYKPKRANDALPKRMEMLLQYLGEEKTFSDLERENPKRVISRELKTAKEKDVPKLMKLFSLPPLKLDK